MSSDSPRRFKVEPIETTATSSKDRSQSKKDLEAPRKFAPEPVETTRTTNRRFIPAPVETEKRTNRRFAPEPIETTKETSKERAAARRASEAEHDASKSVRRFKPELLETTTKKSRKKFDSDWATETSTSRISRKTRKDEEKERDEEDLKFKFSPTAFEDTIQSSRDKFALDWAKQTSQDVLRRESPAVSPTDTSKKAPPRRFAPQLLETARRTRRAGDANPAVLPSDKTESGSDHKHTMTKLRIQETPPAPENTPVVDVKHNPLFLEIQRACASSPFSRRRPSSVSSMRSHSFRVPDLDPIESSESDGEGASPPSPSTSTSHSGSSDHSYMYKDKTRMRESVDERVSGYILGLAAKAAEKQLREAEMAAFPNGDYYERVDHYVDHESDDAMSQADEGARGRRISTDSHLEFLAMQQHQQKLQTQQEAEKEKKRKQEESLNRPERQGHPPWGNAANFLHASASAGGQRDGEMKCMRRNARPPMLGGDIKFPRCASPEPARFDPTQGCDAVKIAMCYLSEQSQAAEKGEGLWCGRGSKSSKISDRPSLYIGNSRSPSHNSGGLWGGFCVNTGETPPKGPSGLLTPRIEIDNPMSPCPTPQRSLLPPTPPPSNPDFACLDEKLATEKAIDEDFGDDFVTQVYNYLSLGYPSIARMFDEELSKVSNIPIEELRQDDELPTSRGYIRLGEDGNLADADVTEESCMRWRALRSYVKVWARQQPGMAADLTFGAGIAVRKGSWAV